MTRKKEKARSLPRRIASLYAKLVVAGLVLLGSGLLLPGHGDGRDRVLDLFAPGEPLADRLLVLGFMVLLAGPPVALVITGIELARRRDRLLVVLAAGELAMLALGLWLGLRK